MKIIRPAVVQDTGAFTRASVATYFDKSGVLQTAVANVPRFTYDPSNLTKPPVLMLENAATNQLPYSEQFDNSAWSITNVSVTPNAAVAPNNLTSADKLVDSAVNSEHYTYLSRAASNETATFSVYMKSAGRSIVSLSFSNFNTASCGVIFDLLAGTVLSVDQPNADYSAPSASIQALPNGWFRCSFTVTKGSVNAVNTVQITLGYRNSLGVPVLSYQGDGISGIYVWGAQLEAGTNQSSYIPTAGSAAIRSTDVSTLGLISLLPEADYPVYSVAKAYAIGDRVINQTTHAIYESNSGFRSTAITTASSVVTWAAHGLTVNQVVMFESGTMPTGLVVNTPYYVLTTPSVNTLTLSTTKAGAQLTIGTSTGNLTAVGTSNYGIDPTGAQAVDMWSKVGSTNKWAVLDQSVESQSKAVDALAFALKNPTAMLVDSVVLQNVNGISARVVVLSTTDGVVYDKTVSLISTDGITDPYSYSFEPIVRNTDVVFSGLPPYPSAYISVSISGFSGETVACGLCVIGLSKVFGPTQAGMSLGSTDYSVKEKDAFGNTSVTERPYAKTMTLTCFVDRAKMSQLFNLLNSFRATPIVYIGDENITSSVQYGFYKDYSMGAEYPETSVLHIEIESMT